MRPHTDGSVNDLFRSGTLAVRAMNMELTTPLMDTTQGVQPRVLNPLAAPGTALSRNFPAGTPSASMAPGASRPPRLTRVRSTSGLQQPNRCTRGLELWPRAPVLDRHGRPSRRLRRHSRFGRPAGRPGASAAARTAPKGVVSSSGNAHAPLLPLLALCRCLYLSPWRASSERRLRRRRLPPQALPAAAPLPLSAPRTLVAR